MITTHPFPPDIARQQDSLLKIRTKFTEWIRDQHAASSRKYNETLERNRNDLSYEYKAEIALLDDARVVFLRLVDEELRGVGREMRERREIRSGEREKSDA